MIIFICMSRRPQTSDSSSLPTTASQCLARPVVMGGSEAVPAFLRSVARRLNKCVHV